MATTLQRTRLTLDPTSYVARTAVLVGDVTLGPRSSVWYGAILRGDLKPVRVGADTNVQDQAILHVEHDEEIRLCDRITVGHAAIVHASQVGDDCLIGIGARVLSGARIGAGSIVGAGSVVTEGTVIPPGSLVLGIPGRVIRQVKPADKERIESSWKSYVELAAAYRAGEME